MRWAILLWQKVWCSTPSLEDRFAGGNHLPIEASRCAGRDDRNRGPLQASKLAPGDYRLSAVARGCLRLDGETIGDLPAPPQHSQLAWRPY